MKRYLYLNQRFLELSARLKHLRLERLNQILVHGDCSLFTKMSIRTVEYFLNEIETEMQNIENRFCENVPNSEINKMLYENGSLSI